MSLDIRAVAKTIKDCALNIDKAKEAVEKGGMAAAMPFAPVIQSTFSELQKFGKLENVHTISADKQAKMEMRAAIEHFIKSADAAKKAIPQAVALLGQDAVNQVQDNLQYVLNRLKEERGGKVTGAEPGGGV